jgi:tetratricopeptide (TPR) repeat protein
MNDLSASSLLDRGIQAARAGRKQEAVRLLAQAVQVEPKSAQAWYWLSEVLEDEEKKAFCLKRAKALVSASQKQSDESLTAVVSQANKVQPQVELPEKPFIEAPLPKVENPRPVESPAPRPQSVKKKRKFRPELLLVGLLLLLVIVLLPILYRSLSTQMTGLPPTLVATAGIPVVVPTETKTITPWPTRTALPSPTPTRDFATRLQLAQGLIDAAQSNIDAKNYEDAIATLNQVIERVPEYAEAYYMRGFAYRKGCATFTNQGKYLQYIHNAINDTSIAIHLDPTVYRYYRSRGYALSDLAGQQDTYADVAELRRQAIEDLQKAQTLFLPEHEFELDTSIVEYKMLLWNCQEGMNDIKEIAKNKELTQDEIDTVNIITVEGSICLGNYQEGLDTLDTIPKSKLRNTFFIYDKWQFLYNMGHTKEAFALVDDNLAQYPSYGGERYYLRAFMYYQLGEYEKARTDLMLGQGNVWVFPAEAELVAAYLAYHDGNKDQGDYWLGEAYLGRHPMLGPNLNNLIEAEVKARGITIEEYTPDWSTLRTPNALPFESTPTPVPLISGTEMPQN